MTLNCGLILAAKILEDLQEFNQRSAWQGLVISSEDPKKLFFCNNHLLHICFHLDVSHSTVNIFWWQNLFIFSPSLSFVSCLEKIFPQQRYKNIFS